MSKYEGHTPGPFRVESVGYATSYETHMFINAGEGPIAGVWCPPGNTEQAANAALLADAPLLLRQRDALLEAAKMVLQRWTFNENQWHTHTWHDMADCATVLRAAIAACERNENA